MSEPPVISHSTAAPTNSDSSAQTAAEPSPKKPESAARRLVNNRGLILMMLFCVTGFLGIPVLWQSESFSRAQKIFWSVVVTLYTCVLIYFTYRICAWSYGNIQQAF